MVLEAIFNQLYFCGLFPQCCSRHTVLLNVTNHPETSRIVQCRLFILPSPGFSFSALEFGNNPKGNREVCEPSLKYASWLAPFPVFLASPGTHNHCNSCSPCAVVYRPSQLLTFQPKEKLKRLLWKLGFFFNSQSLATLHCWVMKLQVTACNSPPSAKWDAVLGLAEPELVFPYSSPHGAVFYVGSWQGVDSTLVLWLLLSSAYTAPRLFPTFPPLPSGTGWARSWEGTQPGQLTRTDQRDIPYHMTSAQYKARLLSIKLGERRKGVGSPLVLRGNHYAYWSPASWEGPTSPVHGK